MTTHIGSKITQEMSATGMTAFFDICKKWGLTNTEMRILIGSPAEATFYKWKRGEVKTVQYDTMMRISYILCIFKALQHLFRSPEKADGWVKRPSKSFAGTSALDRMLGGDITDLAAVRSYLDNCIVDKI